MPESDLWQSEDFRHGGVPEPLKEGRNDGEENGNQADQHQEMGNDKVHKNRVARGSWYDGRAVIYTSGKTAIAGGDCQA